MTVDFFITKYLDKSQALIHLWRLEEGIIYIYIMLDMHILLCVYVYLIYIYT